jgi:hypothetical protein
MLEFKTPEIRFIHAYVAGGRVTVAWKNDPQQVKVGALITLGVGWCAPKDQFRKDKGRLIATGRLIKCPWQVQVALTDRPNGMRVVTEETVLKAVYQYPDRVRTPTWAYGFLPELRPRVTCCSGCSGAAIKDGRILKEAPHD